MDVASGAAELRICRVLICLSSAFFSRTCRFPRRRGAQTATGDLLPTPSARLMTVTESDRWQPLQAVRHPPCQIWRKLPGPPGKGGPIGIARGETAQVLTVASGRSADRSRTTAMGRRPGGGRWPCRAGRRGLPGGASWPARQGVTDRPRSLRIFADHLSETAQVTDAGRLTCAGAAGEPKLAPLRRASAGLSSYGRNESRS